MGFARFFGAAIVSVGALLVGCPGETPPAIPVKPGPQAAPQQPPPDTRDDGRLPPLATPAKYALDLTIDPHAARFGGVVRIDVDVPQRTPHVVLHARSIDVTRARALFGGAPQQELLAKASLRVAKGGKTPEELVLSFPAALPVGRVTLEITYTAPFDDELSGLYRVRDGERWYAFTQFEATDARRAFPCFDEPAFKVPFEVAIKAPPGMIAVANTPEIARDGTQFRFAPTPPLPTYLVAFAVGDFDVRDSGRTQAPPIRLVTTKGKSALGDLALDATSALLDSLEQYFGIPYPYAKLDIVAVPDFAAGAMENPGLITFREERLLLDPKRASVYARRAQALVIAHELAHQWFGNLVTASWWNDLWLNEGMATWLEFRAVDRWRASLGAKNDAVASAHYVMDLDGLGSARAVRQPVVSTSEAQAAFDGITYEKGAAVLSTIERWLGEAVFRKAIRSYLEENAWKSVQADRLLGTLDRVSGKNVTEMASGFLDQPGVPVVEAQLECGSQGRWHAELTQEAWRPLGSKQPPAEDRIWTIPVCVRALGDKKTACAELAHGAPSLVAGQGRCPTAIHPNAEAGYYRFLLPDKELVRLAEARKELDVPSRIAVVSNAWAAVRSGKLDPRLLLKILPLFDDESARQVVDQIVSILGGMDHALVEDDARPAFRKFVASRLAKRKKDLGWSPKATESGSGDEAMMRRTVFPALADLAEDDATLREAEELATKWLADPASIDADAASVAVELASRRADATRLDALREAAKKARTREDRGIALRAMFGFDDPTVLGMALDLVLSDEIRPHELRYVTNTAFGRRRAQPIAEAWIRAHWEELRKKLPGSLSAGLVRAASVGCSHADAELRASFYGPRAATIEGAQRLLAESLEVISLCAELRSYGAAMFGRGLMGTPDPPKPKPRR